MMESIPELCLRLPRSGTALMAEGDVLPLTGEHRRCRALSRSGSGSPAGLRALGFVGAHWRLGRGAATGVGTPEGAYDSTVGSGWGHTSWFSRKC